MGVRGLTNFIRSHPHLTQYHELHDCSVVIDGKNLIHFLYHSRNISEVFGGDYCRFGFEVKKYFSDLRKCNIKPYIVLDGGKDKSGRFFRTNIERWRKGRERVYHASLTGKCSEPFLPIGASKVFKSILSEMAIPFVRCEFEGDAEMAAIANYYQCSVLSDDSDFYILNLTHGFIRLSSTDYFPTTSSLNPDKHFLKCQIYFVDFLLSDYPALDRNSLPLLASLIGNDFVKYDDLKSFHYNIGHLSGSKIDRILEWLSCRKSEDVVENALQFIELDKRETFKSLVESSIDFYKLKSVHPMIILRNDDQLKRELCKQSKLSCPCGATFPTPFVVDYYRGNIPPYFLNVINFHRIFLKNQVEIPISPSSYACSRTVRQIIYGILFQHDASNSEYHKTKCLQPVAEYSNDHGVETCFEVKPVFVLPSGQLVPKLNEIYSKPLKKKIKLKLLTEAMKLNSSLFKDKYLRLNFFIGCLNYWLLNSSPKPTKEFLVSLMLSFLYYSILNKLVTKSSAYNSKKDVFPEMAKIIDKITFDDARSTIESIKKYLQEPVFTKNNTFDVSIIHSYNQLQTCIRYLGSLNKLLKEPVKPFKFYEIFEGTLLYNLTKQLLTNQYPAKLVEKILGQDTASYELLCLLLEKVLCNIPPDFTWSTKNHSES